MISKYKNIADAPTPIWNKKIDSDYLKKVNEFFRLIEKLSDFKVQKGIQKIKDFPKESNQ
jgi:hypothetical protein